MRSRTTTILLAVALLAPTQSPRCIAQSIPKLETTGPVDSRLRLEVSERLRGEFVDFFEMPKSHYDFLANRLQLGARITRDPFELFVQVQHTLLEDLPDGGPGTGGGYYANTHSTFQQETILRAAWLRAGIGPAAQRITAQVGRQAFRDGLESQATDPTLKWIQAQRIAERLIGPFDFTHVGRSFDGAQLAYDNELLNATAFGFVPTAGGFEISANRNIDEIRLAGVAITGKDAKLGGLLPRVFWIDYDDARDLVVVDNRPLTARQADNNNIHVYTVGANAAYVVPVGSGKLDLLGWVAGQFGDWESQDHRAYAYAFEGGYKLEGIWAAPWLRAGIDRSSGDSDPNDSVHESFFQMLPTPRIYAQFPFYNLMNSQDVFAQLLLRPHSRLLLRGDFHWLRTSEENDLFYFGGGATKRDSFGFTGLPTAAHNEIAYVTEVSAAISATDNLTIYAYYAHAFGQGVIAANFADREANYAYLETTLAF